MITYKAVQGDIVWLDFNPQSGREQRGRRPAMIVSNNDFNGFMKTAAMVCPITSNDKGIPCQIRLGEKTGTKGVVMCDQAKILDLLTRNAEFVERAPEDVVFEVVDTVKGFL